MDGAGLLRLRERLGLDRDELAAIINQALGKSYSADTIGRWERGRPISKGPSAFLEELAVAGELPSGADGPAAGTPGAGVWGTEEPAGAATDTPPGAGPSPVPGQPLVSSGRTVWTTACEELWEMIATGVGLAGAAIGSDATMMDGAIIAADKQALGAAWGKLAETNETFRRMLVGMTEGGAWLQVAMVTGTTFSKCWQNHAAWAAAASENGNVEQPAGEPVAA